jgi:hypothetical protein
MDHPDVTDQSSNKGKGAKVFPDPVSSELRLLCFARKRNPIRRAGRFSRCSHKTAGSEKGSALLLRPE